jgi:hypothetical protein
MAEELNPETPATEPVVEPAPVDAAPPEPPAPEPTPEPEPVPVEFTHPILDILDVFRGTQARNIGPRVDTEVFNIADAGVAVLRAEVLAFLKEK